MSLADQRRLRLGTLVVLYVAQGIPWGFTAITIPAYLGTHGLSKAAVGAALATTTLPYAFKWVWGPIIDAIGSKRFGRRRPWIVFAQLMMALSIGAIAFIPDITKDLELLAQLILVHTAFSGLQDVAVDALAVDLLDDDERARANGLMYGAKYGGGVIGGMVLSRIITDSSLATVLVVQAAILLGIMVVPLLVRETDRPLAERPSIQEVARSLGQAFADRSAIVVAFVMLAATFAVGVQIILANALFTQQLGWSREQYTDLTGGYGLIAGGIGAVAGGYLADRVGRRLLAAIGSIGMAAGWLAFALSPGWWHHEAFAYATSLWQAFFLGVMSASLFAVCMQLTTSTAGASQFAAYMALANFSTTLGYRAVAEIPASWSIADGYIACAVVQIVLTGLLAFVAPATARRPAHEGPIPARGYLFLVALGVFLVEMTFYVTRGLI